MNSIDFCVLSAIRARSKSRQHQKMFIIRESMCRTVLLTVLLEFVSVDKSTSSEALCRRGNTRNISHFQVGIAEVDWTDAGTQCRSRNATLPVICNQEEQTVLAAYLKANTETSAAWTSGRRSSLDVNTWIDGRPFNSGYMIQVKHHLYTHVTVIRDGTYRAADPRHNMSYLCQYSGSSWNSTNVFNVTNGCVVPSDDELPWYDARNQCLMNGGDLAILNDADLVTLNRSKRLNAPHGYWVGLRNYTWHWTATDNATEEVEYSNWSTDAQSLFGECISINASDGEWMAVRCTDKKKVVCQAILGTAEATSSTSSPMTTSTPKTTIYGGLGAGIAIIVICIIVIIVVRCRKSHKRIDNSKDNRKSDQPAPDQFAGSPTNPPVSAPLKVPVSEADDMRGIYAEVSLSGLTRSQDVAKPQQTEQPGLLYASLDFQREPNNVEPDQKPTNGSNPTKVGPMGDIYAMPDAKSHADISPGNQSTSHPIKVAPAGDIYALPVKDSKPSATNAPVGRIYSNM